MKLAPRFLWLFLAIATQASADNLQTAVHELEFDELLPLADLTVLPSSVNKLGPEERRAAAVLLDAGVLELSDLDNSDLAVRKAADFVDIAKSRHPGLIGRVGDPSVIARLETALEYDALVGDGSFVDALHKALADGVLTGYDLRIRGVYDEFPEGRYFIYSHSSLKHIQQLVTLLNRRGVDGWVYVVPKVSAFLFRDDWGEPGENVISLPDGRLVLQGREMAVLFRFEDAADRDLFHRVVTQYAKKDSADEPGLIRNAWWQPFYYTDTPYGDFEKISLVILSKGDTEATLTVVQERTMEVVEALQQEGAEWELRVDSVWVNPPFFRFLNGGFK